MVKIEDIAEMNIVVNLSLWSALKLRIAGIVNYIAKEKQDEERRKEKVARIRELTEKPKQATKKDIMYITKINLKMVYSKFRPFWIVILHVTNPNCLLSHAKEKIANTIRSTYMYPDRIDITFTVKENEVEYNTLVDELVNGGSYTLTGTDALLARMVREKYEGGSFECVDVKGGK